VPKTCRAVVFPGDGTYEIREFPFPNPPPGGAILQVEAVGLCGSDVAQIQGVRLVPGASDFPIVPGHEIVGRVIELAPDATLGVSEGDRVAVDEVLSMDPLRVYGYTDMSGEGRLGLWGGYGEYMEIFAGTRLHRMSDRLPAEELTLFEPLASAVNWVDIVGVDEGDTVVIEGPGHQGLAVLEAVLAKSPAQVIVTGTSEDGLRLDTARSIGATAVVMVDTEDVRAVVSDLTHGRGADVVFDVATAVQTVPLALELVRQRGRVLLAGLKHFHPIPDLATDHIVLKGLAVYGGPGMTPATVARAVELIESGRVRTDLVVGEVFGLDGIDEAMSLLTRAEPGRDAVRVGLRHTHPLD
jgi:threonine dehydrogenase-like Zn-dependent dehydrogenase